MKAIATAFAAIALSSLVEAHMFISSPVPIAGSAPKDPLSADGSNFPCHGVTLPTSGGTSMAVGSTQLLSFDTGGGYNTAVHGGGSCQISITYETDPVKVALPSSWYVLYSIEEGCPTNSPLNLDGSYTGPDGTYSGSKLCNDTTTNGFDCVNQFNFSIPEDVMNGHAIMAWTWFNTVGNREMYMNCVNVEITDGASDLTGMASMPEMFVANLAATNLPSTCGTTAMQNLKFPNPGEYLTTKLPSTRNAVASATSQYPIVLPASGCPSNERAAASSDSAASASTTSSSTTTATSSSSAAASSTSTSTSSASVAVSSPATSTASTLITTKKGKSTKLTKSKTTKTKASTVKSSTTSSATASSTCAAGSVACTTYNDFICIDATHYGICDYNLCAVSQAVAPGTMCNGGTITWAT